MVPQGRLVVQHPGPATGRMLWRSTLELHNTFDVTGRLVHILFCAVAVLSCTIQPSA